ncbi:MAG TPA: DUF4062 domain-containing protein [Mucilaginibacter sp.]|nr:DUF4062 domain-containing protein [Mucilaginibacter sp.]
MAKPRIFVSSTYYDLKHIRRHIESFIKQFGYDSVLFESGDIPFHHDQPLDESCYAEIETCHILILIIGGKYGSPASTEILPIDKEGLDKLYSHYNSITKKEYERARDKGLPIFIFVDKGVYAEYETFKKNRKNTLITYAHVDNVNIFRLLDDIVTQRVNNFVRGFENFDDITTWLKEQWAGLFADFLSKKTIDIKIKNLQDQIEELKEISGALKVYNEALVRSTKVKGGTEIIEKEESKLKVRRALRFRKEPLIEYLIKRNNIEITAMELYNKFVKTKTLIEFCIELGIEESFYKDLTEKAHEDYNVLRNNYFGENIALSSSSKEDIEIEND